jgi:hypothetical protein
MDALISTNDAALENASLPVPPPAIVRHMETNRLDSLEFSPSISLAGLPTEPATRAITGIAASSIYNRWVTDAGFVIGEGVAVQDLVAINFKKLSAFLWHSNADEVDVGVSYRLLDTKLGAGTLSFSIGAQSWLYPSDLLSANSRYDLIGTATLSWNGPIELTADYKHLFAGQSTEFPGELLVLKAARSQELYRFEGGSSLSLRVEAQAPLRHRFFKDEELSVPCVRPGASLRWQDEQGKWSIEALFRYQIGLDGSTPNQEVFGFRAQYAF